MKQEVFNFDYQQLKERLLSENPFSQENESDINKDLEDVFRTQINNNPEFNTLFVNPFVVFAIIELPEDSEKVNDLLKSYKKDWVEIKSSSIPKTLMGGKKKIVLFKSTSLMLRDFLGKWNRWLDSNEVGKTILFDFFDSYSNKSHQTIRELIPFFRVIKKIYKDEEYTAILFSSSSYSLQKAII